MTIAWLSGRLVTGAPLSAEEITVDWMNGLLQTKFPGARVSRVELGRSDIGTTSRRWLHLGYSEGVGPGTAFVKAQGSLGHRIMLASTGTLFGEARALSAPELLPLEVPEVYGSVIERRRLRTLTVMEDVSTRGGEANSAVEPLTIEQVADGLSGLAALHGRYWARTLPEELGWVRRWRFGPGYWSFGLLGPRRSVARLSELGKQDLMPGIAWSSRYALHLFRHSCRHARTGPQTLLHGDAHVGNTYRLPGSRIGFYDWQFIRSGAWSHDVGYFLVSALSVEQRRSHEADLLRGYLEALGQAGATPPSFEEAWLRYRQTPAYGLIIWLGTHGFGGYQTEDKCLTTIERFARAFDDHETAEVVQV